MVVNLSLTVHALPMCIFTSLFIDEMLLPRYVNWSFNFRSLRFYEKIIPSCFIWDYIWNILTSDSAELSDDKCTCVNNRCIRSKISEDNLDCRRVKLSANVTLTRSRWATNSYITRCDRKFRWVGDQSLKSVFQFEEWEPDPAEARPPGTRLSSPGERKRNAVIARRVGVNMLQSLFSLQLTSHTITLT